MGSSEMLEYVLKPSRNVGKSFVWWHKEKNMALHPNGVQNSSGNDELLASKSGSYPKWLQAYIFKVFLPYIASKTASHSDAYMSWDSGVHRIFFLFETELQFPEKIKWKNFFSLRFAHFSLKTCFFASDCLWFMADYSNTKRFWEKCC